MVSEGAKDVECAALQLLIELGRNLVIAEEFDAGFFETHGWGLPLEWTFEGLPGSLDEFG